jgi:hypothetical protein
MPENVPPKETAKADGLDPNEQVPGQPRASAKGPAVEAAEALAKKVGATVGGQQSGRPAGADDDYPGPGFVRIRWKNKIGGHEQDEEWAEERRAHNLVGSGHAEIVERKDGDR